MELRDLAEVSQLLVTGIQSDYGVQWNYHFVKVKEKGRRGIERGRGKEGRDYAYLWIVAIKSVLFTLIGFLKDVIWESIYLPRIYGYFQRALCVFPICSHIPSSEEISWNQDSSLTWVLWVAESLVVGFDRCVVTAQTTENGDSKARSSEILLGHVHILWALSNWGIHIIEL